MVDGRARQRWHLERFDHRIARFVQDLHIVNTQKQRIDERVKVFVALPYDPVAQTNRTFGRRWRCLGSRFGQIVAVQLEEVPAFNRLGQMQVGQTGQTVQDQQFEFVHFGSVEEEQILADVLQVLWKAD